MCFHVQVPLLDIHAVPILLSSLATANVGRVIILVHDTCHIAVHPNKCRGVHFIV
jgi:hypothetical protein